MVPDRDLLREQRARAKWRPDLEAVDLSPIMLKDDPRISSEVENSAFTLQPNEPFARDHPLSETLLFKHGCTKREADFFELAGDDLAMPLVSRIGWVEDDLVTFCQEYAVIERGIPLFVTEIQPQERVSVSLQVADLVSRLHARGIVHGDINPGVIQWNSRGRLVFSDMRHARLANKGRDFHPLDDRYAATSDAFLSPRLKARTNPGRGVFATEADDLYAMAVTIWSIWAGQWPESSIFRESGIDLSVITDADIYGDAFDILEEGGIRVNRAVFKQRSDPRELSPPPSDCGDIPRDFRHSIQSIPASPKPRPAVLAITPQTGPAESSTWIWSPAPLRPRPTTWQIPFDHAVELPADNPVDAPISNPQTSPTPSPTQAQPIELEPRIPSPLSLSQFPLLQDDGSKPSQAPRAVQIQRSSWEWLTTNYFLGADWAQSTSPDDLQQLAGRETLGLEQSGREEEYSDSSETDSSGGGGGDDSGENEDDDDLDDDDNITWEFPRPPGHVHGLSPPPPPPPPQPLLTHARQAGVKGISGDSGLAGVTSNVSQTPPEEAKPGRLPTAQTFGPVRGLEGSGGAQDDTPVGNACDGWWDHDWFGIAKADEIGVASRRETRSVSPGRPGWPERSGFGSPSIGRARARSWSGFKGEF
ncbi:hypothetical protein B0T26DRAFT_753563 [Lasiosphaeria miniovina]|uniref:Protein kinase domain-containing protein n=1 Tax=Lasiosphaeria miniovina TaxID=1954250 RepID=A0AA40ACN1_9PEZI|nr:uncharacterized protein B0T26DRAFT_753563 [Lasiosphaeria miniovina]KAK0713461.1 hypothetical protein B0T26DRAFT_753563 [Lasiosphaeria miniovina]